MTIEKFKEKCDTLIRRKDGIALANFLKRHLVFCMTHAKEVEPYLKGISGCAPAVQNENLEKEVWLLGTTLLVEGGAEVTTGIVGGITAVWTEISTWIVETLVGSIPFR